jgi:hypothetical protein
MSHSTRVREQAITSLAIRLKGNQLSSDEFEQELIALTLQERASLVEHLHHLERGLLEINPSHSGGD